MQNLDDILKPDEELTEEQILKYLEGALPPPEQHTVEAEMANSAFTNDAIEGLSQFGNKQHILNYVEQLNRQLQKQTSSKKERRNKRKLKEMDWIIISVISILLLCLLAFAVVKMYNLSKNKRPHSTTSIAYQRSTT
ncbi:MAG: hypothetical protein KGO81_13325 [Bacteroidota bacterium]|nr:hypothetical protein [Bacteroidota bacterium]